MNTRAALLRRASTATAAGAAALAAVALTASPALAHGSMRTPVSRVLTCYQENPESPRTAACKAAVSASGKQAFYDWNGVRIGDVAGRHRQRIPNGKLCSAGQAAFRGLDLPRADWPATSLKSGVAYTFRYQVTAVHRGRFQLYITKNGYDPRKPLKWSDLESKPFLTKSDPTIKDGAYQLPGRVPAGKKGRHLIYAIWQRSDSPEAFYSCSDVVFSGKGTVAAPPKPKASPTRKAAAASKPAAPRLPIPTAPLTGHEHQHGGAPAGAVNARPAAQTSSDAPGTITGTVLMTGTAGLALGGIAGLLLTGRRPRRPRRHT
ncbi:lytic polysaccharide monooxygenase auxiliary activity family 9 protein [Actinomadura violacea]|uniref:Lytic polysaccharide monooxygenase n=1 Tax=Actinomadura violacea TaxID=2819934 RepID=A0ABS3S7U5_9ACTN|nr:lytic polysaccharide monooxygenase [Actinomadura violacea]MBO2465065.1 lytic polysaccharide monooxygenase [Actinomadura violacea]